MANFPGTNIPLSSFKGSDARKRSLIRRLEKDISNEDIDGLVDWYESADNLGKTGEENSGKTGSTVMGATSKELDSMVGGGENVLDLSKEAAKKGGTLDMEDFMELHDPRDLGR